MNRECQDGLDEIGKQLGRTMERDELDVELGAIRTIVAALGPLRYDMRVRVLNWANSRFDPAMITMGTGAQGHVGGKR